MEENSAPLPEPEKSTAEKSAAEATQQPAKDDKHEASSSAVHEAAHAAANIEAEAAVAAAQAEKEAAALAKDVGARPAQKWLEARVAEIEKAANDRLEGLKKWLDERLAKIEGKKSEGSERQPDSSAKRAGEEQPGNEPRNEPAKKRYRRI